MPSPPDSLVTTAQLSRYGVPPAFLAQFVPRAVELLVSTGGALGTMQFEWRWHGDAAWSQPIASSPGTPWPYTIEDAFADLTFAAFNYVLSTVYTVGADGAVTGGGAEIGATRFDLRTIACSSVTSEATLLMEDALTLPIVSWGDDVRTHAAAMVYAQLKRARGATPPGGGQGDENVFVAEDTAKKFFEAIGERGRPASIVDSATGSEGALIPVYPVSDAARGW